MNIELITKLISVGLETLQAAPDKQTKREICMGMNELLGHMNCEGVQFTPEYFSEN